MSARNRPSSNSSSMASRSSLNSENSGKKFAAVKQQFAKKRPALTNITNRPNASQNFVRTSSFASATMVPCVSKIAKTKKGSSTCLSSTGFSENSPPPRLYANTSLGISCKDTPFLKSDKPITSVTTLHAPGTVGAIHPAVSNMDASPSHSDGGSVSLCETMCTCDSLKSPEFEYKDNDDPSAVDSIERKKFNSLFISKHSKVAGVINKRGVLLDTESYNEVSNVDHNFADPQQCAGIACDIYRYLRASETKKRPSIDYMERVQKDINASMRAILIDWLVEVGEEYRLVPDTLFLTVNYIDRYLSGNVLKRQKLQLLGVSCMMIAAKYEEICAPHVQEFCYITDNTYFKEEVLQMESAVLNYLKFEMTAPTMKCFLRQFVRAAQGTREVPSLQLECLATYITELSLLEYCMLRYAPSLIAASATFLAKFLLLPSERPWNSAMQYYTLYWPSDLCDCVIALHRLFRDAHTSSLPAIREKYSQHRFKFVAKKYCPPLIPPEFFLD